MPSIIIDLMSFVFLFFGYRNLSWCLSLKIHLFLAHRNCRTDWSWFATHTPRYEVLLRRLIIQSKKQSNSSSYSSPLFFKCLWNFLKLSDTTKSLNGCCAEFPFTGSNEKYSSPVCKIESRNPLCARHEWGLVTNILCV